MRVLNIGGIVVLGLTRLKERFGIGPTPRILRDLKMRLIKEPFEGRATFFPPHFCQETGARDGLDQVSTAVGLMNLIVPEWGQLVPQETDCAARRSAMRLAQLSGSAEARVVRVCALSPNLKQGAKNVINVNEKPFPGNVRHPKGKPCGGDYQTNNLTSRNQKRCLGCN